MRKGIQFIKRNRLVADTYKIVPAVVAETRKILQQTSIQPVESYASVVLQRHGEEWDKAMIKSLLRA